MATAQQTNKPATPTLADLREELACFYASFALMLEETYRPGAGSRALGLAETESISYSVVDVDKTVIGEHLPAWYKYAYEGIASPGFDYNLIDQSDGPGERLSDLVEIYKERNAYIEWCWMGISFDGMPEHLHLADLVDRLKARRDLDQGNTLSLDQLAVLAGMNERSVRNATNAKDGSYLELNSSGSVDNKVARDWLVNRRGFTPTTHRELPEAGQEIGEHLDKHEIPIFINYQLLKRWRTKVDDTELPWQIHAADVAGIKPDRIDEVRKMPMVVKPEECIGLAEAMGVDKTWFTFQVMSALFPEQVALLLHPPSADDQEPMVQVDKNSVTITLSPAMIAHGYLDIPASARSLFPEDSFGAREGGIHGQPIELIYGEKTEMTDIREKNRKWISPRKRFNNWLRIAKPGDRVRLVREAERQYTMELIGR